MISIEQARTPTSATSESAALASVALFSNPNKMAGYVITSFSMDVARNFIGDTYSFSNTYSLNFQGVITDLDITSETLSGSIKTRISELFIKSKFDYKVKSLTFPSDNGNPKDLSKTAKFAISFEVRDAISSSHTDFTGKDAIPKPKTADFNNLLPAGTIVPFGAKLRDISESFNIDDSEDGSGTFTHSINFSLMPAPALVPAAGAPIRPDSTYFRNNAGALVNSLTVYSTFVQLTSLFEKPYSKFKKDFFTQNETFTHAESFDLFNFSYSLTRTKSFNKDNATQSSSYHSYNLVVNEEGIIEVTEETKIEGKTKSIADVRKALEDIEGPLTQVIGYENNTYKNVRKSYGRCQDFLDKYKRLLRYNTANASIGRSGYSSKTGVDSLRPIAIERNMTLIPGSPNAVYSVKYTNNPNINFGYECDESIKADASGSIFNITHSISLKTFNLKDGQKVGFDTALGSNLHGTTFLAFKDAKITESRTRIESFLNGTKIANDPYLPVPSLSGILAGLRKSATAVPFALIKQSTNVSERGRNFSLTLTYSSDNKYGPLLYLQNPNLGSRGEMFTNLGIPTSAALREWLSVNFCSFNVKVASKLPVEKFTQKVIVQKEYAAIEPSFSTSIGTLSIILSGKMKKSIMNFTAPADPINNTTTTTNLKNIVTEVRSQILQNSSMTHLKAIITSLTNAYLVGGIVPTSVAQSTSWIPTNVSYKYNSELDFEMNVDLEFYAKKISTGPGPIFYYKTHSIT